MNTEGVLDRLFNRLNRKSVEELMRKWGVYPDGEKVKNKAQLRPYFLELSSLINEEELKDFVEMAVHVKNKGLPAFTHKLVDANNFTGKSIEDLKTDFQKNDFPIGGIFTVSSTLTELINGKYSINFKVKKYEEAWRSGELNIQGLSAVYKTKVTIDLNKNIVTIFSGDDETHGVIYNYLGTVLRLPIQSYRIKSTNSKLTWEQNASYLTALFLDFVFNRLKVKGYDSTFSHIKFKVGSDDIKEVTINGKNIINSYLACEYIVLGRDIINFKIHLFDSIRSFSCNFELKSNDMLKIVVLDVSDESAKEKIMTDIQEEYISLCESGIMDYPSTSKLLERIAERFANKEKLFMDSLRESIVSTVSHLSNLLHHVKRNDSSVIEVQSIVDDIKSLSENLDISENQKLVSTLSSWITDK